MQQGVPNQMALQYGRSRRLSRWSRPAMFTFAILFLLYTSFWLVAAWRTERGGYVTNLTGHSFRFPPHEQWPRAMRLLFEPAYRVDRWLRPTYWEWDGPLF